MSVSLDKLRSSLRCPMMMVARGLVRLTIDGDDTSHTTHNLRDCFSVFTRVAVGCEMVVCSKHHVKVSSAVFYACTVRFENMCPHVSYSGFCIVVDAKFLLLKIGPMSQHTHIVDGRRTT